MGASGNKSASPLEKQSTRKAGKLVTLSLASRKEGCSTQTSMG